MNIETNDKAGEILTRPQWLDEFERANGRPLRVLHIGNIANNAYVNAKIMRAIAIDADVICYDYYHMMGTPEWEAGEYTGDYGDAFFPDWWRVKSEYKRPDWFFQGPRDLCLAAANAKFENEESGFSAREIMKLATWFISYRNSTSNKSGNSGIGFLPRMKRRFDFTVFLLRYAFKHPIISLNALAEIVPFLKIIFAFLHLLQLLILLGISSLLRLLEKLTVYLGLAGNLMSWRMAATVANLRWKIRMVVYDKLVAPMLPMGSRLYFRVTGKRFSKVHGRSATDIYFGSNINRDTSKVELEADGRLEDYLDEQERSKISENDRLNILSQARLFFSQLENYTTWQNRHRKWHSHLDDDDLALDLLTANGMASGWDDLLKNYDIVQCYSTDGIIPMPLGLKNCFCFEHGTLRSIPFENNVIGRLTATAYKSARGIFVTNVDNMDKPEKLQISPEKSVWLPHPLDYPRYIRFAREHNDLRPRPGTTVEFFSAARQHWKDKDPGFAKGNDVFFHALARTLKKNQKVRVVLVEWGRDVQESKKLLVELGLSEFVTWVPPMKIDQLWKRYLHAHAVVDQFIIPAFGRVTFDSLIFGKRVISNLDRKTAREFFGVAPPMLVAGNITQAMKAVKTVLDDPDDTKNTGPASAKWAAKYHSSQRVLDLQLAAYHPVVLPSHKPQ